MRSLHLVFVFAILASGILTAKSNPTPFVNQPLVPAIARPGSKGFTLTVNGTGFVSGAVVNWNHTPRPTKFISNSMLQATISAGDVAKAGTVTVLNPGPGGGSSNLVYFLIRRSFSAVAIAQNRRAFEPGSVATADFNGDGKLDLAIGNGCGDYCDATVDVYLGNGDGTFGKPIRSIAGEGEGGRLFVADFNADGKPDVAITLSCCDGFDPPYGYILLGNGDGTFTQGLGSFTLGAAAAGDLNGDGLPDLITASPLVEDCNETQAYLANADGSYTFSQTFYGMGNPGATLGDFNGDGRLDLAANADGDCEVGVLVALGNGDGTFQKPVSYESMYRGYQIQAVDLNGDGKLDLVTDAICTLLGNGDGTFTQGECTQSGVFIPWTDGMVVADFNGDGKADVALMYQPFDGLNTIFVYPGNGDGTFGNAISYALPNVSGNYTGMSAGDFNGDGRFDFAVGGLTANGISTNAMVFLQTVANVSPTSLSFGTQVIGKQSQPQIVTLTNDKSSTLTIKRIRVAGVNRNAFAETSNCESSLPGGGTCEIKVIFRPRTAGVKSASLLVSYEGEGGPQFVRLSGTGTALDVSPDSEDFGDQKVGTHGRSKTITLSNLGRTTLSINGIDLGGDHPEDFVQGENYTCGDTLLPGHSCKIQIRFTPRAQGLRSALLVVNDSDPGSPHLVPLSGTGT